jgi:hypothetical protein
MDSSGSNRSVKGLSIIQPSVTVNLKSSEQIFHRSGQEHNARNDKERDLLKMVIRHKRHVCRSELTILAPTVTLKLKVSLSLTDTVTAVACSAALLTIGSKITPTNSLLIDPDEVKPSIESTRNPAVTVTN